MTLGLGVKGFMAIRAFSDTASLLHSNGESPSFVSHSQLEVSLESILMVPTGVDLETFWESPYVTMRRM